VLPSTPDEGDNVLCSSITMVCTPPESPRVWVQASMGYGL